MLPWIPVDAPTSNPIRMIAPIRTEFIREGLRILFVFGESKYEKAAKATPARKTPPMINLEL